MSPNIGASIMAMMFSPWKTGGYLFSVGLIRFEYLTNQYIIPYRDGLPPYCFL